jgi:branched-chain amino acid transport system ATP-binding protein
MLELRNIVGGYGQSTVLRDVSLTVPDGSVVALLGPNGAGKSTTLRMASGLLRPKSGTVLIDGHDVTRLNPYRRTRRACVTSSKDAGSSLRSRSARIS